MKKRLIALLLALAMGLSLSACGIIEVVPEESQAPDPSPSLDVSADPAPSPSVEVDLGRHIIEFAAGVAPEETLLTVNGQDVPADLYLYWLALNCIYFESYYGMYGLSVADFGPSLLSDSVSMTTYYVLLKQMCLEQGCPLTDEQLSQIRQDMLADGEQEGNTYENRKALYGLTDDTMEFVYSAQSYYENLLDAMIPAPTDEELNSYVYQAKHILLLTVDMDGDPVAQADGTYAYPALDDAVIAEKKALAEQLLAQLQAADDLEATFDELMNQYSEDSGLAANPDGYTAVTGEMVAPFEQAALALDFGGLSGIVESSYGYHIILRGQVADLDSYAGEYREARLDELVTARMEEADVVRSEALDNLDVGDFYTRYTAYQSALQQQITGEAGGSDGD